MVGRALSVFSRPQYGPGRERPAQSRRNWSDRSEFMDKNDGIKTDTAGDRSWVRRLIMTVRFASTIVARCRCTKGPCASYIWKYARRWSRKKAFAAALSTGLLDAVLELSQSDWVRHRTIQTLSGRYLHFFSLPQLQRIVLGRGHVHVLGIFHFFLDSAPPQKKFRINWKYCSWSLCCISLMSKISQTKFSWLVTILQNYASAIICSFCAWRCYCSTALVAIENRPPTIRSSVKLGKIITGL